MGAGWTNLTLVLLVATTLAGCSNPNETLADDGSLKTNTFVVDSSNTTHGYVTGLVLTEAGNPVPGARVTILTVETSATTDPKGEFNFTGVAKGAQDLRVEKDGYKTLQRPFVVEAGKIIEVEVILARADGLDGGMIDHYHDHWRGQDLYTIYEARFEYDTDVTQVPPTFCGYLGVATPNEACRNTFELVPDEGHIVPPGTSKISIDISFEPGPLFEQEQNSFAIHPPPSPSGVVYSAQGWQFTSGEEHFEYELPAADIVDFGHARYTNWQFWISEFTNARGATWASAFNLIFRSPIDITITAHKGDLLIDPPHPRYWDSGSVLQLEGSQPGKVPGCIPAAGSVSFLCTQRTPTPQYFGWGNGDQKPYCDYGCMVLDRGGLVPPGATRLEFDLEIWWPGYDLVGQDPGPAIPDVDFVLGYKAAKAPTRAATWDDYAWADPVETYEPAPIAGHYGARGQRYSVPVSPGEEDEFYTIFSQWLFMMGVKGHETADTWADIPCHTAVCGYANFEMNNIVVYNDAKANDQGA